MESGNVTGTVPHEVVAAAGPPANQQQQQNGGSHPLPTSDRIPPHVFDRTSTAATDWSAASTESLFSIHAANTSFSKEQLNWMSKSGELGYNCDSLSITSPLLELPRTRQFTEFGSYNSGDLNDDQGQAAAEAMREVLMEQESHQKDNVPAHEPPTHSRSISNHSDTSVKSFAFPVMTEADKGGGSPTKNTKNKKEQSQNSTNPEENSEETSKPDDPEGGPKEEEETLKPQSQKSTKNAGFKKWFSCFSCCSS